jgi:hypothetical protein
MAYATVSDLGDPPPGNAQQLLERASRAIDRALLTARYDPTDPAVVAVLKAATVEQVWGILAGGDKTGLGISGTPQNFTLGRLSVQRGPGLAAAPTTAGLVDQAFLVLQAAGLTGQAPQEPW